MKKKIFIVAGLIGVGIVGRLVPHVPNATPISAIAIAGARSVGKIWAFGIPLAAMLISDAVIGFYDWRVLASVYISFAFIAMLGLITKKYPGALPTIVAVIGAPVIFFLITNGATWAFSPWYEKSISGLLYCFSLGLPFFRAMLVGDIIYASIILFALERFPSVSALFNKTLPNTKETYAPVNAS